MTYATSDLHGCCDKYVKLLQIIDFKPEDTLYVLGDIVDRGDGGIRILQDMRMRGNVIPLRGNHDFTAQYLLRRMFFSPRFQDGFPYLEKYGAILASDGTVSPQTLKGLSAEEQKDLAFLAESLEWLAEGGAPTLKAFSRLLPAEQKSILKYIDGFWIYDELELGGRSFFLAHTVPERERLLKFDECSLEDFMYGEPEYDKVYFPDRLIVTGHTPTLLIDEKRRGRICRKNNHIAIDCGAAFGLPLACVRLDDLREFYAE